MRSLFRGLLIAGVASPAFAGDIDNSWLRGSSSFPADPPPHQRWGGFYGGGQVGGDFSGVDLRKSVGPLISNIQGEDGQLQLLPLASMSTLPVSNTRALSYGGFMGYNYQIDDIVLGFELNFNRTSVSANGYNLQQRGYDVVSGPTTWRTVTSLQTSADAELSDYGTVRVRGGWAYGNFLPYVFAGFSAARVDASRSVNVSYTAVDITPQTVSGNPPVLTPTHFPNRGATYTDSDISHGKYTFGFDAGLGIDYAITRNIFIRGEVEYLQLSSVNDIRINTASARAAVGLKF